MTYDAFSDMVSRMLVVVKETRDALSAQEESGDAERYAADLGDAIEIADDMCRVLEHLKGRVAQR